MKAVSLPSVALLISLSASSALAQSVNPTTALQSANYTVFSGDFNGDTYPDILAKAKPRVVLVGLDDFSIPIPTYPIPIFVLLSNSDGSYTLVTNPPASTINSGVWQAGTHTVAFGDFLGNGVTSMLIRASAAGGVSFTVTSSSTAIQPTLLQKISSSDLDVDLGAAGKTVDFSDANRDGRSDLIVRTNGRITDVFVADSNGIFSRAPDSAGSIAAAWSGLRASLDASDPASAANFISGFTKDGYTTALQGIVADLPAITQTWSAFEAVRVDTNFATYLVKQTYQGDVTDHFITFVREKSRWVVSEF